MKQYPSQGSIHQQSSALWQTYTEDNTKEFWQHYEKLLKQSGKLRQKASIQQARLLENTRPFSSVLRIAPHLRPQLQEVLNENRPSPAPIVLGTLGALLSLPFMFDGITILLLVVLAVIGFLGSVGFLAYGVKNYRNYGELKDLFGTVLEIDDTCIARINAGKYTTAVKFDDITTISTENFGLVLKTMGENQQEQEALLIPFAMEQFEELKTYLFQRVHQNNRFKPELQNLNVTR